jgi:hypothetical protein
MWLETDLDENNPLIRKIEYMTMQSCERRESEIHYRNITRKYITFDLRDGVLMSQVGRTLKPFGVKQFLQNKFADSGFFLFRIWAEKGLARRGENHLKGLYKKHPDKFFDVEFDRASSSSAMNLLKCSYIIDEMASQKRVCLKEQAGQIAQDDYVKKVKEYEQSVHSQHQLVNQFNKEENAETEALLSMDTKA